MIQEKFLIARNGWSAKHILARVSRGEILPEAVLFDNQKSAFKRISSMRPMQQSNYSVFKINWISNEKD